MGAMGQEPLRPSTGDELTDRGGAPICLKDELSPLYMPLFMYIKKGL